MDAASLFEALDDALMLVKENMPPTPNAQESTVVFLPDGDSHVCKGFNCPHVELNLDKCYCCTLSGVVFGASMVRDDFSTGRQAGSSNPDDTAGEPVGGSWRPKKDLLAMSNAAYNAANTMPEEGAEGSPGGIASGCEKAVKRGARCVDEACEAPQAKRPRIPRRNGSEREQFRALQEEAESTLCKLVNFDKRAQSSPKARDPRLQDKKLVFDAALKKYIKECLSCAVLPTIDAVHNIAIAASTVAATEKRKAREEGNKALLLKVRMREMVTSLACSLWQASCASPYMEGSRRGADSFKPFVCGVLYALKRGVKLPNGVSVVPTCPELTTALPVLRSTAENSVAKALHASSHRGLCTLHRSISSCNAAQASELFDGSAQLARQLAVSVKNGQFDL
jgi:hypothetical protein